MKTRILFFCLSLCCTSLFAQVNLSEGLISQYSMDRIDWQDQKLLDAVGNNDIHTSDWGYFDDDRNGGEEGAYRFSGTTERVGFVNVDRDAIELSNLDQFSLAFWHVGAGYTSDESYFFSYLDENGNGFKLHKLAVISPSVGEYEHSLTFSQIVNHLPVASSVFELPDNNDDFLEWYHFSFVFDFIEDEVALFLNGEEQIVLKIMYWTLSQ